LGIKNFFTNISQVYQEKLVEKIVHVPVEKLVHIKVPVEIPKYFEKKVPYPVSDFLLKDQNGLLRLPLSDDFFDDDDDVFKTEELTKHSNFQVEVPKYVEKIVEKPFPVRISRTKS
jgi:hypothetical protein